MPPTFRLRGYAYTRYSEVMAYMTEKDLTEMLLARLGPKKHQQDIAQELGVAPSFLSDVLKGRRRFTPRILRKLGYDPTPHYRKLGKEGTT
jgi:hypothetical protein